MTEWTLEHGDQTAVVCALGGRLRSYRVGAREVLAGEENPELFAFRGSLLAPWPNRVVGGRWTWDGVEHQLPVNDHVAQASLHGLVYDLVFALEGSTGDSVSLLLALEPSPGYPFPLLLRVTYSLSDAGMACSLSAVNTGSVPAPVGLGVHPYIAADVDNALLRLPASTLLDTDSVWRETGRSPVGELDFRDGGRVGDTCIDAAFTGLSGNEAWVNDVRLAWGPSARWLVVYTGHTLPHADHRRSIAVEPQTCPPNALQTGEIDVVAPGNTLTLEWGFHLASR